MIENRKERRGRKWSGMRPHHEFLELCATFTTGELAQDERARLKEHLATCPECREALDEFELVATVGAPLLSSVLADSDLQTGNSNREPMEIAQPSYGAEQTIEDGEIEAGCSDAVFAHGEGNRSARLNWNYAWLSFAAAVLLTLALSLYAFEAGTRHVLPTAQVQIRSSNNTDQVDLFEQQLSDAGHEREILKGELAEREQRIAGLQTQIATQSSAFNDVKNLNADLARSLQASVSDKEQIAQEQASANQSLAAAQASLAKIQSELDSARQLRNEDELRSASLRSRVDDLEAALNASQQANAEQQALLTQDADIRDLMGARDLYIAEVYDVGRDGSTQKPYGRVFYTRGKSLIFYAYDLDQQPGAKGATTFQAWGQNGPDRQQALSLGMFYEDSVAKKRWVLKFDNARALEQINAVFVTVEPNGGSHTPSGKSLLFASLKIEPNHP